MSTVINKKILRERRHRRIRSRVQGTKGRPRLSVFKSNRFIYAQLIDDDTGKTLVAADSKGSKKKSSNEQASEVGKSVAEKAKGLKITQVVFDRGGFIYTGNIRSVAEGAREGGLIF